MLSYKTHWQSSCKLKLVKPTQRIFQYNPHGRRRQSSKCIKLPNKVLGKQYEQVWLQSLTPHELYKTGMIRQSGMFTMCKREPGLFAAGDRNWIRVSAFGQRVHGLFVNPPGAPASAMETKKS